MKQELFRIESRLAAASAAALILALVPAPLLAQSANDWRLPGATVRPAPPGSQGPVDRDNPVVTTAVPRPTQTATPEPAPTATEPASRPAASTAAAPAPTRNPAPRPAAAQQRQVGAVAAPTTTVAPPSAAPITEVPAASPVPDAVPTAVVAAPTGPTIAPVQNDAGWYWKWIAGAAALIALLFAGLWLRRGREAKVQQVVFERPVVPAPQVGAKPQPVPEPAVAALREPGAIPQPSLSAMSGPLGIALEARRMSASLMATTLSYVVTLTNTGTQALSAVAVEGDMISAHASLAPEAQIANDNQVLEARHNLVALAPGESAEFTGDFRLPLTAVTPIRAGDAAYFVPLARLRVKASDANGESLIQVQTYVVGELPDDPAAALKPFRLDLGPRTYSRVGQRAVS